MKHIRKGREPASLQRHRQASFADFDNYPKPDLQAALLEEQGHLCCYCMRRITAADMKIEHWASQKRHPSRQLDYRNLLGACHGSMGKSFKEQHCDTHKGEEDLVINPVDEIKNCERLVRYLPNGEVMSDDPAVHKDLVTTLNLNTEQLRGNRKRVVDVVVKYLSLKQKTGTWSPGLVERELLRWKSLNGDGKYEEYCQVAVYYLEKKLKRA
jgi:uncharacterized protein (TIGR02646 family)